VYIFSRVTDLLHESYTYNGTSSYKTNARQGKRKFNFIARGWPLAEAAYAIRHGQLSRFRRAERVRKPVAKDAVLLGKALSRELTFNLIKPSRPFFAFPSLSRAISPRGWGWGWKEGGKGQFPRHFPAARPGRRLPTGRDYRVKFLRKNCAHPDRGAPC